MSSASAADAAACRLVSNRSTVPSVAPLPSQIVNEPGPSAEAAAAAAAAAPLWPSSEDGGKVEVEGEGEGEE